VAALEFAMIAPACAIIILGLYDIAMAVIVRQEVQNAAHMIEISASNLAVQPDKSTSLTVSQVQQTLSGIFAEIPGRRNGTQSGQTSATMSSVTFVQVDSSCNPATTTCQSTPHVVWSVAYTDPAGRYVGNLDTFQNVTRPCGQLTQTAPGVSAPGDLTTLPTLNVANPDAIVVVDIHYQYQPLFTGYLTGPVNFWASAYWSVRSVSQSSASSAQYTKYDIANENGGAGKCPGYT
jgi:Flp pilus assembly protein TadG